MTETILNMFVVNAQLMYNQHFQKKFTIHQFRIVLEDKLHKFSSLSRKFISPTSATAKLIEKRFQKKKKNDI